MRKFTRKPCPSVLLEPFSKNDTKPRWMIYGEKFAKQKNKSKYSYPQINKKKLNHLIFPTLIAQTQSHCSYCDCYPLMSADETIDHFKPKSKHPHEVCNWDNLYVACAHCQKEKLDKDHVLLLRPDKNYKFSTYFFYDYSEHRIEILPQLKGIKLEKAQMTDKILNFNHPGMIASRRISYDGYWDKPKYPRKKLAHRFIFQ